MKPNSLISPPCRAPSRHRRSSLSLSLLGAPRYLAPRFAAARTPRYGAAALQLWKTLSHCVLPYSRRKAASRSIHPPTDRPTVRPSERAPRQAPTDREPERVACVRMLTSFDDRMSCIPPFGSGHPRTLEVAFITLHAQNSAQARASERASERARERETPPQPHPRLPRREILAVFPALHLNTRSVIMSVITREVLIMINPFPAVPALAQVGLFGASPTPPHAFSDQIS